MDFAARSAKFLTAIVGAVTSALALGLLPSPADKWAGVVLPVLTAAAVWLVPNAVEEV